MIREEIQKLDSEDIIEPETIRRLYPQLDEKEFNKLNAEIVVTTTNYPYENFYVFENIIRALNGIIPNIHLMEGLEPEWLWYGLYKLQELRPGMEYSHEVIEYIKFVLSDNGIYFLPKFVWNQDHATELSTWYSVFERMNMLPEQRNDDTLLSRQKMIFDKLETYKELKDK
jgi:hypothetical protein